MSLKILVAYLPESSNDIDFAVSLDGWRRLLEDGTGSGENTWISGGRLRLRGASVVLWGCFSAGIGECLRPALLGCC
jgi:hypothetical protein